MQQFEQNVLFNAFISSTSDLVFLFDAQSLALLAASNSALTHLNTNLPALQEQPIKSYLGVEKKQINALIKSNQLLSKLKLPSESLNKIDFVEMGEYKLALIYTEKQLFVMVIKHHISQPKAAKTKDAASKYETLVKNTPGLVFEFRLNKEKQIQFDYLSDGCMPLLGIAPEELLKSASPLLHNMNEEDLLHLSICIDASVKKMQMLNWEGRIWIEEWQDTKWINLRSIPKKLKNGVIQWSGIMTNITQSKNEKFELEQSRKRLSELSAHLTRIKEEERNSIAREIHDDLGGNLTVIKIGLDSLLKKLPADDQKLQQRVENLRTIVDSTFEAAHRISGNLRPNILELGIVPAIEWQAKEFEKQIGIPCSFVTNNTEAKSDSDQAITLFRICQEAMSNIAKYAQATRVDVALLFGDEDIKMYVTDNGIGIKKGDMLKADSFGLHGMEERVVGLNGQFSIEANPEGGTNITVILPKNHDEQAN